MPTVLVSPKRQLLNVGVKLLAEFGGMIHLRYQRFVTTRSPTVFKDSLFDLSFLTPELALTHHSEILQRLEILQITESTHDIAILPPLIIRSNVYAELTIPYIIILTHPHGPMIPVVVTKLVDEEEKEENKDPPPDMSFQEVLTKIYKLNSGEYVTPSNFHKLL